jgi:predicted nucleotidyltransferase
VSVFGSFARGSETETSDLIYLLNLHPRTALGTVRIERELGELTNTKGYWITDVSLSRL